MSERAFCFFCLSLRRGKPSSLEKSGERLASACRVQWK